MTPVHSRQGVGEAVERFAWAAGVYEDEQMLADINTIRAALSSQAEALEAADDALQSYACYGPGAPCTRDMEDCRRDCGQPAGLALDVIRTALSTYRQTKEDTA